MNDYIEIFKKNYNVETPEAKLVMANLKTLDATKKRQALKYADWVLVEMAMKMQDPTATVEVVRNSEGGLVHIQEMRVEQQEIDAVKGKNTTTVSSPRISFIVIRVRFMGVEVEEYYPILDRAFQHVAIPQNSHVNNAIQRGKVKAIARITGIGLSIFVGEELKEYEMKETEEVTIDNSFTPDKKEKEKTSNSVSEVKKEEPKEKVVETPDTTQLSQAEELAKLIISNKGTEKYKEFAKKMNAPLAQVGVSIDGDTDERELAKILSGIKNLDLLARSIKRFF